MAEVYPKVHPVADPEAPPTAPLVPEGSTVSEKGDPAVQQYLPPPVLVVQSKKRRRSCCCRCLCWTISLLILLVIIIAAVVGILYLVFQPKAPSYTIDRLTITKFSINNDLSISAKFIIRLKAYNPNKKIGIYYEDGSNLTAWYTTTKLCQGSFPVFYQGHQNTTILDLELNGEVQDGTTLLQELNQQQQTGSIPLVIDAKVPVKIKFGSLKLMKMKPRVRCTVVVNSLSENNSISIKSSSCKLKFKF